MYQTKINKLYISGSITGDLNFKQILNQCDAIFMLPDWKDSKGACVEHETAIKMNIPIFYEL